MNDVVRRTAPEDSDAVEQVSRTFRDRFGKDPWGVFSAPGRANLIGEHIDYSGGTVLPFALPHRTFAAVAPRTDRVLRAWSVQEGGEPVEVLLDEVAPGRGKGWTAYVAGVAWALEQEGLGRLEGADLVVDSAVPLGAGLSSSAALECSVAMAWDALISAGVSDRAVLAEQDSGRALLAAACIRAENEIAGASTGGMDQSVSLRAAAGSVLAIDCRDFSTRSLTVDVASAGLSLLLVDTRAPHRLVDGQYARRRTACDAGAAALGLRTLRDGFDVSVRAEDVEPLLERWDRNASKLSLPGGLGSADVRPLLRHAWSEMARAEETVRLFSDGPGTDGGVWTSLGKLLDDSHESLRHDYRVTVPQLDLAVDSAREAGTLGARMIGGGFGGSVLALVRREESDRVAAAVARAFSDRGFEAPEFLDAVPSAGARRDR